MKSINARKGMGLKDALCLARRCGATIDYPHATGEVLVSFPDGRRVRMNNRRKDASARLTCVLKQLSSI
jgi:hypothetical protein